MLSVGIRPWARNREIALLVSGNRLETTSGLGVQSKSLETLMGKVGLRYGQDHTACADARDLRRLLAVKHKDRTYLGRLLDSCTIAA